MSRLGAGAIALLALVPALVRAEDVVVTGEKRSRRGLGVLSVGEKEIQKYGQTSVGETLERLPSIHGASDDRGERILSLRGFDQRGIVAMVDGVPLAVPYDGQIDLSKLPIDTVERVVVTQGSTPLLYGPNGTGGAIDVITREPTSRPTFRAQTELAPMYSTRTSAAASVRFGKDDRFGVLLGGAYENRRYVPLPDGFEKKPNEGGSRRLNSDRTGLTGTWKVTLDADPRNRFAVSLTRFGGDFGIPPGTRDFVVRNWRWTDWHATVLGVSHTHTQGRFQIDSHLYGSFFDNTLDSYDNDRYRTQLRPKAFHSVYSDRTVGGFVRTTLAAHERLKLVTWTGLRRDSHTGIADRGAPAITADSNLFTTSMTGDVEVVRRRVFGTLGAQLDGELPSTPSTGAAVAPSAGLGPLASLSWQNESFSFGASGALRSRTPTLRERFGTVFGARAPNPLLHQERAFDLAVDAGYKSKWVTLDASLFDSTVKGLVTELPFAPGVTQLQNVSSARFFGAEGRAQLRVVHWLDVDAGLLLLSARRDGIESRVAYKPSQKATLAVTLRPHRLLSVGGVGRVVGGQDYQNPNTNQWERLGSYALLDARVDLHVTERSRLWVRAQNLTGANVEARYSFPEAGRQLFVGFGTRFEP